MPASLGGGYKLSWEMDLDPEAWFKVWLDRIEVSVIKDTFAFIHPPDGNLSVFEVLPVGPGNRFADYQHLLEVVAGNKAYLTWTGSATGEPDHYNIYTDNRTEIMDFDTVLAEVAHAGVVTHYWKSAALIEGTWKFAVRAVDKAGNKETNVTTVTIVIDTLPEAVTDLAYTFSDATKKITLTWTVSPSADIASYRVFGNGGSGFIDYSTVLDTKAHPTVTWESPAIVAAGTYMYGIRAVDSGANEEQNTDVTITVEIVDIPPIEEAPDFPNAPIGLTATPIAGAKFTVAWLYDGKFEEATPDTFSVYWDNGTGTMDWVTPMTTVAYSAGVASGRQLVYSVDTAALVNGTDYQFAVRAKIGSDEEANEVIATDTADSTAPAAPTALTGAARY